MELKFELTVTVPDNVTTSRVAYALNEILKLGEWPYWVHDRLQLGEPHVIHPVVPTDGTLKGTCPKCKKTVYSHDGFWECKFCGYEEQPPEVYEDENKRALVPDPETGWE